MKVTTLLLFSRLLISRSDLRPQRTKPSSSLFLSASGSVQNGGIGWKGWVDPLYVKGKWVGGREIDGMALLSLTLAGSLLVAPVALRPASLIMGHEPRVLTSGNLVLAITVLFFFFLPLLHSYIKPS